MSSKLQDKPVLCFEEGDKDNGYESREGFWSGNSDFLAAAAGRTLDILFDHDPRSPEGHLVEVESPAGTSVKVGEWIDRGDGYWALRLTLADFLNEVVSAPADIGNLR